MRPTSKIEACLASHQHLLNGLATITEEACRQPSALPGFTRAHLMRHLANKTKAHLFVLGGPAVGEVRRLHPEGYDADVAAADAPNFVVAELVEDLAVALDALEAAWDGLNDRYWSCGGIMTAGSRTMAEVVGHHLRNVEVHHVDLNIGYTPECWPQLFVEDELARRLKDLPQRANDADLLAWLLDRGAAPGLSRW